jgi:hypothetical protein
MSQLTYEPGGVVSDPSHVINMNTADWDSEDFGPGATITTTAVNSFNALQDAINNANTNGGNHVINVEGTHVIIFPFTISRDNVKISLRGSGTIQADTSAYRFYYLFEVGPGILTLRGPTLQGTSNNSDSLVNVNSGGAFIMRSGKITGNADTSGVSSSGGGCGGAVYVNGGSFDMYGGEISGNSASHGGGVYVHQGAFNMYGGLIKGNTATDSTGGKGGGVYIDGASGGTFLKTGGTIAASPAGPGEANSAYGGSTMGHAVFVSGSPSKYRDSAAGPEVNLDSATASNWGQ